MKMFDKAYQIVKCFLSVSNLPFKAPVQEKRDYKYIINSCFALLLN